MTVSRGTIPERRDLRRIKTESRYRGLGVLRCACGKRTKTMCFFTKYGPHGACANCGELELVQLATGSAISRVACEVCCSRYAEEIWETAVSTLCE